MAALSGGEDGKDEVFIGSANSPVLYFCHMDGDSTSTVVSASITDTGHWSRLNKQASTVRNND